MVPDETDPAEMARYYLNECGFSVKLVADRMRMSVDAVDALLVQPRKEIPASRPCRPKLPNKEEFAELYNDKTIPLARIAELFQICRMTVSRLRNRYGLPPRQIHRRSNHE